MLERMYKKGLVVGIIVLFIGMSIATSTGKIDGAISRTNINDGSLLGYVNDTSGNLIEGALVRVYFHETYEEDYSNKDGYYHVTNIPICYCLKNVSCSKLCYTTEWVLLSIVENTTHDFILNTTNHPPKAPRIIGPGNVPSESIKVIVKYPANYPPGGKPIEFSFEAIDPDGDDVRYYIEWGDGDYEITGFYPSGEEVKVNHTYTCGGVFTVKALAEDTCGFRGPAGQMGVPIFSISAKDNNKIELQDNNEEIITFIDAFAYGFKIKGIGLGVHIEIWGVDRTIDLEGYRYPLFPLGESNFVVSTDHVIAPHFIGIWYPVTVDTYSIKGIAIGNIEWS